MQALHALRTICVCVIKVMSIWTSVWLLCQYACNSCWSCCIICLYDNQKLSPNWCCRTKCINTNKIENEKEITRDSWLTSIYINISWNVNAPVTSISPSTATAYPEKAYSVSKFWIMYRRYHFASIVVLFFQQLLAVSLTGSPVNFICCYATQSMWRSDENEDEHTAP